MIKTLETAPHGRDGDSRSQEPAREFMNVQRSKLKDVAFFRMAAHILGEATIGKATVAAAAREAARWLDKTDAGKSTVKASTLERDFPAWKREGTLVVSARG